MRKKYLSALLFGALLFASAGTFTSCKDYDDDISNLQTQVDKLATKEDMEAKLTQMQTAVTEAKTSAQEALSTAKEALDAAQQAGDAEAIANLESKVADQETRIAALEDALGDIDALKEELQNTLNGQIEGFRTEMNELVEKVEGLVGKLADMVTSVELVYSNSLQDNTYQDNTCNEKLDFSTAVEQKNVFSEGIGNAITFTDGKQVQTGDKFIVRVSPTNAVLTPEMISFVNSKGENLNEFLKVSKVEKYNGLLFSSRAENNNGLWEVSVELQSYNTDAFNQTTTTKVNGVDKKILFAVQVNNTLSTAETREVISAYDITMDWSKYEPANQLQYFVDATNVNQINNRYGKVTDLTEYTWNAKGPATAAITKGSDINVTPDANDNRSAKDYALAVQGEPFTVSLTENSSDSKVQVPANIRAMYVVLDKDYAYESSPSELNAWESYTYTGLNTVVEGSSLQITINSDKAINDIIGFRVFAVNYDGTLVDPDGKAFYVKVGDQATDWNAANTVITPDAKDTTTPKDEKSAEQTITLSKLTGAVTLDWSTDKIGENAQVFDAYFVDAQGNEIFNTAKPTSVSGKDLSKVAKIYTVPALTDWKQYEDDKTYNGELSIKNSDGFVLATLDVTMTKKLPTALPDGFSIKTAQVQDGIYKCYMIPMLNGTETWTADKANQGSMKMTEVFNFGEGVESQYKISFATSKKDNNKDVTNTVTGDGYLVVDKAYINNETQHATTVVYNYGKISSKKNAKGEYDDWTVKAADFNTIYNCIYNDTYTWTWANNAQLGGQFAQKDNKGNYVNSTPSTTLIYGMDYTMTYPDGSTLLNVDAAIYGTSAWDSEYNAMLSKSYNGSLKITSATLTSNANGEEEYFDVQLDNNGHITGFKAILLSSTTNPTADVPSTLTIKAKDMYGHDVVIKLPMTVKKR